MSMINFQIKILSIWCKKPPQPARVLLYIFVANMGRTEYCLNLKGFLCLNCLRKILGFITEKLHLLPFLHFSYFLEKLVLQKKDFMMTMVKKSSHLMLYKNYILSTYNLLLERVLPANFPLK